MEAVEHKMSAAIDAISLISYAKPNLFFAVGNFGAKIVFSMYSFIGSA